MPVHVDEMTTEVEAFEGDMPLSQEHLNKLVELICSRIEEKQRERELLQESAEIRPGSISR